MDTQAPVRNAPRNELERQPESSAAPGFQPEGEGGLRVDGVVDLKTLAMAVVGSVAGGP